MKPQPLTQEEVDVVTNPEAGDVVLLELIKGMSIEEMRSFDVYGPKYLKHYKDIQLGWLMTEKHLLSHRDCKCREVSEDELLEDLNKCHNGERFRVFYVLKYPNLVERIVEK